MLISAGRTSTTGRFSTGRVSGAHTRPSIEPTTPTNRMQCNFKQVNAYQGTIAEKIATAQLPFASPFLSIPKADVESEFREKDQGLTRMRSFGVKFHQRGDKQQPLNNGEGRK